MILSDSQIKECSTSAGKFLATAKVISGYDKLILGYAYPCVTNAAFACELAMKAIYAREYPYKDICKQHKLNELFNQLSVNAQTQIEALYNNGVSSLPLKDLLIESNAAFVDWRYAYEKVVSSHPHELIAFGEALMEYLKSV